MNEVKDLAIRFDENGMFEVTDDDVLDRIVGGASSFAVAQEEEKNAICHVENNNVAHCGG